MTETPAELPGLEPPGWLAGLPDRERLRKIMAAVHRCYMEHEPDRQDPPSGPHMTISMAENFIAQMLPRHTT